MRRLLAIPCLVVFPLLLAACKEQAPEMSCAELEKRGDELSKTVIADSMKVGRAKVSGDTKTVCQTTSTILSDARPMYKAAGACNSLSLGLGLNKLIRTMEETRNESKCG